MSSSVSSQRDDILSILRNVNSNKNFDKTEDEETLGMRIETKVYLIINPMILCFVPCKINTKSFLFTYSNSLASPQSLLN